MTINIFSSMSREKLQRHISSLLYEQVSLAKHTQLVHEDTKRWFPVNEQGRSQPHSPGWARVPLSSFLPQISINFPYFSSNFTYFDFGPPGGRLAHPGRPWLRHYQRTYQAADALLEAYWKRNPTVVLHNVYMDQNQSCLADWYGNKHAFSL